MSEIGKYIATQLHAPEAARNLLNDFNNEIASLHFMPTRYALVSNDQLALRGVRSLALCMEGVTGRACYNPPSPILNFTDCFWQNFCYNAVD